MEAKVKVKIVRKYKIFKNYISHKSQPKYLVKLSSLITDF